MLQIEYNFEGELVKLKFYHLRAIDIQNRAKFLEQAVKILIIDYGLHVMEIIGNVYLLLSRGFPRKNLYL